MVRYGLTTDSQRSTLKCFGEGFSLGRQLYYLAALPFLLDLLTLAPRYIAIYAPGYSRFGLSFSFPVAFPSLANFYSFPGAPSTAFASYPFSALGAGDRLVSATFGILLFLIVYTAVVAFLSGGFLGRLSNPVSGVDLAFTSLGRRYFARLYIYALAWELLSLGLTLIPLSGFLIVYLGILFFLDYLLFLTPFVVVMYNESLLKALRRSVGVSTLLASSTVAYVLVYAVATLLISIPVYFVLNLGVAGFVLGVAITSYVGTCLVASTVVYCREVVH